MNNTQAILVLNAIAGFGNQRIKKLIEFFGSAAAVFQAPREAWAGCSFLPEEVIENFFNFKAQEFLQKETSLMSEHGVVAVTFYDENYPQPLKNIPDAPVVLYVKGEIPQEIGLSIAIVGSRKASLYGLSMAEKFAMELSDAGFCIISGMARGIDTRAHQGALKAKGRTVAVLGSGLCHIYPAENEKLFHTIAQNGAVISEFPMRSLPLPTHFPRRNRIVSGLSLGVLVIEAAQKSGALITSDCALEQGKEVFALPGPVDSASSFGVHNLIKQGAKLVCSKEDILEELEPQLLTLLDKKVAPDNPVSLPLDLNEKEWSVVNALQKTPLHFDEIVDAAFSDSKEVGAVLLNLELKKIVKQLPGKFFAVQNQ